MGTAKVKKFEKKIEVCAPAGPKECPSALPLKQKNTYICAGMTIRNLYRLSGVRLLER